MASPSSGSNASLLPWRAIQVKHLSHLRLRQARRLARTLRVPEGLNLTATRSALEFKDTRSLWAARWTGTTIPGRTTEAICSTRPFQEDEAMNRLTSRNWLFVLAALVLTGLASVAMQQ